MSTVERYNIKETEQKWQKVWADRGTFEVKEDSSKEPYYVLEMFPYPSGRVHIGHARNYVMGDIVARYRKAQGYNVIHPMGWDAFGLPAENAAIERKSHPADWTYANIKDMRAQLQSLGLSFDWSREIATCHPEYYRHEQKMFLDFLKKGIAYRKESVVNWDPVENTVLANEQVVDGKGWRSGVPVERRKLNQWFLKITDYAEELLSDLSKLDKWPEKVRVMQENWIGKSQGVEFFFKIEGDGLPADERLYVFTTRADTIMGTSFAVLAPEHPLSLKLAETDPAAKAFIEKCQTLGTSEEAIEKAEKEGFKTPWQVIHPLTGERLPVYIGNFVIYSYGTGAIKSAPAHDERDFAFATKYGLPIRPVITGPDFEEGQPYPKKGTLVNSGSDLDGLSSDNAIDKIISMLEKKGVGKRITNFRLRDWGVSRQRYWGAPIPVVYCDDCGCVPVPEEQLPVELPYDINFDAPQNPLARHPSWKNTSCPTCDKDATRETDTFDTFFESSWYFARYCDPRNTATGFDKDKAEYWCPVDQYIGGVEHAVLHLLYARFFTKALRDCGYWNIDEPFKGLFTQGMVVHATYKDEDGKWLFPSEIIRQEDGSYKDEKGRLVKVGSPIKMSKSKKNVIPPEEVSETYGIDAARLFVVSDSPPERDVEWTESGIDGSWRFINKLHRVVSELIDTGMAGRKGDKPQHFSKEAADLRRITHATIKGVASDIENFHMNKAVARIRELSNAVFAFKAEDDPSAWALREAIETLILLINPMTPHLAEELWQLLGHTTLLAEESWPICDDSLLVQDTITLAVQVNGKVRATITLPKNADEATAKEIALSEPNVQKSLDGKQVRKFIYVPGRIVNVVGG
ncbi:MAG: leucine--tRNA ligase [Rhodospirillales bacterium]|nr:leucine--tRNA ligase [Rhodospirillales bacterium]MCB9973300.1 leucine--tRNA ligase [Rhodospirillales bacterium]MCB9973966.1 leucine--tRNA ligase [Rhodospirillales bacterium]